ncbi:CoxG family protein [Roseinatronobacter alkalisoli]|uniref:Carbon monoxide dehydrogenase subunit G n=1 Tax=Roseinatronobacter alkalisoli TaxID=3028235 RepID=A0ABT5T824_9RHOB|nr:carbon monoxide dehydrogenase subunit G [Roseinatronobacter sp. HJB301]MDD7970337.1 carbon monoxide dehydrogenase subunit G [Roseinatronobacter sp. HJB301]
MQMNDTCKIAASPQQVWNALFDADVLKACVPGCQELSGTPDQGYEAVVVQKVGPVKATFKGMVTMADVVTGESCTLIGEGKGGVAGFAKGQAQLRLEPTDDGGTILHYGVDASVGGKLAQLGSRVVDGFARRMATEFFTRFQAQLEGPEDPAPDDDAETPPEEAPEKPKSWTSRILGR